MRQNVSPSFFYFYRRFDISTLGKKLSDRFDRNKNDDEYELFRKYLSNKSSFGNNKPKMWVQSKFMNRSHVSESNESTCSSESEHHYIYLSVETIVECSHNYNNVCLINDDSFSNT